MKTILSTKKLSDPLKQKVSNAGLRLIEYNFIKTKKTKFKLKKLNEYVVFTSKNAIKSILKSSLTGSIKERKVFCVGQKTKQFLIKNNFIVAQSANYGADLASIIQKKYKKNSFTFFSGNIRNDALPNILNDHKIDYNEVVVYKTTLTSKKITENKDAILFFSPSAVESYLLNNLLDNQMCFCIGTTTAKALEHKTKNILIASHPTVENVIEQALEYYKNVR